MQEISITVLIWFVIIPIAVNSRLPETVINWFMSVSVNRHCSLSNEPWVQCMCHVVQTRWCQTHHRHLAVVPIPGASQRGIKLSPWYQTNILYVFNYSLNSVRGSLSCYVNVKALLKRAYPTTRKSPGRHQSKWLNDLVRFSAEERIFLSPREIDLGIHPASYPVAADGQGASDWGCPSTTEVKHALKFLVALMLYCAIRITQRNPLSTSLPICMFESAHRGREDTV